jgi:hypothetical protein
MSNLSDITSKFPNVVGRHVHRRNNVQFVVVFIIYHTQYKCYVFGYYPSSCSYLKLRPVYISNHNVSETGFCLRIQVKSTQLGRIDRASPYLRRQGVALSIRPR